MKRTCNRCRAMEMGVCGLGYPIAKVEVPSENYEFVAITYKPLQECPKPTTYAAYLAMDTRLRDFIGSEDIEL